MNNSFTLLREQHIPEINSLARLYRHNQTGAEILSVINDDENKSFGITFRTPSADSTGVAHIMEHSVLCGSRKYPVKEPFIELVKGSLNTFLNALTFADKTTYPVASTNLQDFYNLVDVYLDAVFFPLIPEHTLMQEGWHYELESPDAPLEFKGVVFNEMKGAYSSPDNVLGTAVEESLFPDHPYQYDSGGNPEVIPDLTYAQFKKFHETYYHPSNARIYFYGDDDPEKRLELLETYLQEFEAQEVHSEVPVRAPFDEPRRGEYPYDAGDDTDKKAMTSVNWVLAPHSDRERALAFGMLSHILSGTPASPLRKALIDSGLGEDTTGGLDTQIQQLVFSAGLKGLADENAGKVETLVLNTLQKLADEGLDSNAVEASLNTFEFRLRENNTGGFPRGLALMFRTLASWNYGSDPIEPLGFEDPLQAIKAKIAAGEPYFENLIRTFLLDNPHRTTILLKPDPEHRTRVEAAERARLDTTRAAMTDADVQTVIEQTQTLKRLQETPDSPEAIATLPFLKLSDLDKDIRLVPTEIYEDHGIHTHHHDLFTNGIVYLDVAFNLRGLPQALLPYFPLFSDGLIQMGTYTEDFVSVIQRIGRKTGGLYASTFLSNTANTPDAQAWLVMRGKSTVAQTPDLLAILRDLLLTVNFDNRDRFRQLVLESKSSMEAGLVPSGHGVVNRRLRAHFDEAGWLSETMGGLTQLFFLRQLAQDVENDWDSVLEKLETIRTTLIQRGNMLANVTLDADNWKQVHAELRALLGDISPAEAGTGSWTPTVYPTHEGFTIPAQVNYVGKGTNLYNLGYEQHGSANVIRKYLGTTWLWEKVRVQGGAYGGFANWDRLSGVWSYGSYRDPNLLATLDNYDGTAQFLRNLNLSDDELTKAIIGTISDLDGYQLPDAKGYTAFLRHLIGINDENRQQLRDEVLGTTQAHFRLFGEALEMLNREGQVVVLGSAEKIGKANEEKGGNWLDIRKVL
ncbi:MAG: insulinase family protein [Anaerolineales bacterium]|nr:insulinase family protein [Anaerolineales bacterium]